MEPQKIATTYIQTWLLIDVVSCVPFNMFAKYVDVEDGGEWGVTKRKRRECDPCF